MMGVGSAFGRQPSWSQMRERIRMGLITPSSVLMSSVSLPSSTAAGPGDPSAGTYIPQVRCSTAAICTHALSLCVCCVCVCVCMR
jgi:hypothetical protein